MNGDLTGRLLNGRYQLMRLAGAGGMADVYYTYDRKRATYLAVKVLRRDLANNTRLLNMFRQEAEVLSKLTHPNIVRLYETDQDGDIFFLVMDWVEGENLKQRIEKIKRPLELQEVLRILSQICPALSYAHQNQVFHCDVKPANILMSVTDNKALLTDFGVARLVNEKGAGGTPFYMAPEQFTTGPITPATDVYALGITLYEMLTGGLLPYRGHDTASQSQGTTTRDRIGWEHLNLPLPNLSAITPGLSPRVIQVWQRAVDKEPANRYANTMELLNAFYQALPLQDPIAATKEATRSLPITLGEPVSQRVPPQPAAKPEPYSQRVQPPAPVPQPVAKPEPYSQRVQPPAPVPQPISEPVAQRGASSPPVEPAAAGKTPYLTVRNGQLAGESFPLKAEKVAIGRNPTNHIRLSEPSVSRQHAEISVTKQGVFIRDMKSTLGTVVNGQKISAQVQLHNGDIIQVGIDQIFEFHEG